jgi:LuxR family maltose regulon positive regulatory protein
MSILLRTKLYSPTLRPDLVPRQRLLDRLDAGLWSGASFARKLTLISAPAGFGKTTLVAEWIADLGQSSMSWLSLDDADNNPTRFLTYLIAALQGISPEIGLEAQVVLQAGAMPGLDDA